MDFDFSEVLAHMVSVRASDVHLTAGFPPAIREKGRIEPMDGFPVLSGQETREVVYSILNDDQRKRFENNKQLDFAYAIPGVARFRVNCFFQRGSVSAAFRLVPQEIPALDSLGVPQVLRELAAKPRGFVLVTGPEGTQLQNNYSRFGMVTGGLDVAQKLESFADPQQKPTRPLYILSVTVKVG